MSKAKRPELSPVEVVQLRHAFWKLVDKGEHCWRWRGDVGTGGYGHLEFKGQFYRAHRVSYFLTYGVWPYPICMHDCRPMPDDRLCVRPDHLRAGTVRQNNRDQTAKGVTNNQYKGKTHCQKGHAWTPENTIWRVGKYGIKVFRECRTCWLARKRVRRQQRA